MQGSEVEMLQENAVKLKIWRAVEFLRDHK
jgi:hypothetical protein